MKTKKKFPIYCAHDWDHLYDHEKSFFSIGEDAGQERWRCRRCREFWLKNPNKSRFTKGGDRWGESPKTVIGYIEL